MCRLWELLKSQMFNYINAILNLLKELKGIILLEIFQKTTSSLLDPGGVVKKIEFEKLN